MKNFKTWVIYKWSQSEPYTLKGIFWNKMMLVAAAMPEFPQGNSVSPFWYGFVIGLMVTIMIYVMVLGY